MTGQSRSFRLGDGLEQLEQWSGAARQSAKNSLYKALFAVTDASVFRRYGVLRDTENPWNFFVLVREDLVLKIGYSDRDTFGILYIGPLETAPGLDVALEAS